MNLSQSLADLRHAPAEQWLRAANRTLPVVVAALLVLLLARELASLTWLVLSGPPSLSGDSDLNSGEGTVLAGVPGIEVTVPTARARDYSSLTGWRPFGEPPASEAVAPTQTVRDAPDTNLNLTLYGTHEVVDPDTGRARPELGTAMISSNRQDQKLYHVGNTIEGASGAKLHSVYVDHVLLDRGGRFETLRLPREIAASAVPLAALPNLPGQLPGQTAPRSNATSLREALSDNAAVLADVIRTTPQMEGGQMIGFRLAPGRNRDAFNAIGLQPGDVLTEVNGLVMNDPRAAMEVFSTLSEATVASVTIMRNGTPEVLTIDMSTIEAITENSQ